MVGEWPPFIHSPLTIDYLPSYYQRAPQLKRRGAPRVGTRVRSSECENRASRLRRRYFDGAEGALTFTSTFVVFPPNTPLRHAKSAAITTIRKITSMATTPVLLELSESAIVFESSKKSVCKPRLRTCACEAESSKTKHRK